MKDNAKRLDKVYREQRTAVYHTALTLLKNAATAEDVMQEVFLAYYRELEQGREVRHLKAWLLTATRNRCYNALRDGRHEHPTDDLPDIAAQADPIADLQEQDMVERVLACLGDDERLAFCLHYMDGYTYRQIAEGLGIPMGTVQTRCRIARGKLRAALRNIIDQEEALV
ncbi:MAG: sigma-70 family RNA polymerase sigma factor [Clostridia bacterium]|nr:sigma-70 family RNA polymerase sigma factor [Clostridia bacterium]